MSRERDVLLIPGLMRRLRCIFASVLPHTTRRKEVVGRLMLSNGDLGPDVRSSARLDCGQPE